MDKIQLWMQYIHQGSQHSNSPCCKSIVFVAGIRRKEKTFLAAQMCFRFGTQLKKEDQSIGHIFGIRFIGIVTAFGDEFGKFTSSIGPIIECSNSWIDDLLHCPHLEFRQSQISTHPSFPPQHLPNVIIDIVFCSVVLGLMSESAPVESDLCSIASIVKGDCEVEMVCSEKQVENAGSCGLVAESVAINRKVSVEVHLPWKSLASAFDEA